MTKEELGVALLIAVGIGVGLTVVAAVALVIEVVNAWRRADDDRPV